MKILNLFAGAGGNRILWGDEHEVTAVEYRDDIAACYKQQFPNDEVIVGDAYEYLETHFTEFDLVWASPPCQSHTRMARTIASRAYNKTYKNDKVRIPDMRLYGLIFFLQHMFRGKWIVENVIPFYKPLIPQTAFVGRHSIWSNVEMESVPKKKRAEILNSWKKECVVKGLDLELFQNTKFKSRKDVIVHNCMDPEMGKYLLDCVIDGL
ncbi:MAG: DNA cytosine methyltransferase [PVC group bacterium]|nr:DNA cytosine methyltransferase [PVC group bacterium]